MDAKYVEFTIEYHKDMEKKHREYAIKDIEQGAYYGAMCSLMTAQSHHDIAKEMEEGKKWE